MEAMEAKREATYAPPTLRRYQPMGRIDGAL